MTAVHSFRRKLAYSKGIRQDYDLDTIKDALTGCVEVIKTDETTDKTGVDYIATLRRGGKVNIDAKSRERGASRYWRGEPELAVEVWSVLPHDSHPGVVGWTLSESTNVDYILYTFDPSDCTTVYLIPFQLLRMALINNYKLWAEQYGLRIQHSVKWSSAAMFVPANVVIGAVCREMQKGA